MSAESQSARFEQEALPHLNSAYNLARWLTRNDHDAEDIVQEAYLRAFKSYEGFRGGDPRPWLLTIVRNVYYTWLHKNTAGRFVDVEENLVSIDPNSPSPDLTNPEQLAIQQSGGELLRRALEDLPVRSREMLVLRELEGLSYKEIATLMDVPTGTVMSTLSRARTRLRQIVTDLTNKTAQAESSVATWNNSGRRPVLDSES